MTKLSSCTALSLQPAREMGRCSNICKNVRLCHQRASKVILRSSLFRLFCSIPQFAHANSRYTACEEDEAPQELFRSTRRLNLLLGVLTSSASWLRCASKAWAIVPTSDETIIVDPSSTGSSYVPSIAVAIQTAPANGVIHVSPGRYLERLVLTKPLTIEPLVPGTTVEVVWETPQPYQSTIECSAPGRSVVRGLTLRHYSKSVANNYAVYIKAGGCLELQGCDISSASGSGVACEGGRAVMHGCRVHDCVSHGVAAFGSIEGEGGSVVLQSCALTQNGLNGLLVREGAAARVEGSDVSGNGQYGMVLQDAFGVFSGNTVTRNRKGSVYVKNCFDIDVKDLSDANTLDQKVVVE